MKYSDMRKLTVYRVIKSSSDKTFKEGDIIWKSSNGDIFCMYTAGWITPSECGIETLDFILEKSKEFEITEMPDGNIYCRKIG